MPRPDEFTNTRHGATIMLPVMPAGDKVYEHHLAAARLELENFGLADAALFAAKLQKAG